MKTNATNSLRHLQVAHTNDSHVLFVAGALPFVALVQYL